MTSLQQMAGPLINKFYHEWIYWQHAYRQDGLSMCMGAALVAKCSLDTVLIYNGTKEYYEHGNGD